MQVITVTENAGQAAHGFIQVMMMRRRTHSKLESLQNVVVNMPSLDVYKSDGEHIYHGTKSQENASLLDHLTDKTAFNGVNDSRSLELNEIPVALSSVKKDFTLNKDHGGFIVLSMSYPGELFCKEQNLAVEKFRRVKLNATLIEVMVHK